MPDRSSRVCARGGSVTAQPGTMNPDRSTLNQVNMTAGSGCPLMQVRRHVAYSIYLLFPTLKQWVLCPDAVGGLQIANLLAKVMGTPAPRRPKASQELSYQVEWQALSPAAGLAQPASCAAAASKRHVCSWQLFRKENRAPVRALRTCRRPPGKPSDPH